MRRISVEPKPGFSVTRRPWETSYPLALIQEIHAIKGLYLCDEIMREEDPRYVEHYWRHEVLAYVDAAEFAGKRVLDFGYTPAGFRVDADTALLRVSLFVQDRENVIARFAKRGLNIDYIFDPPPDFLYAPALAKGLPLPPAARIWSAMFCPWTLSAPTASLRS